MLDSSEFNYEPYRDSRVGDRPGFTVGGSGPLLLAVHKRSGKKYIVKHTYPHNAANEYVACWLAERLRAPAPKAFLLSPDKAFASKYAVAIEYLEGFRAFPKDEIPEKRKAELIAHFALCLIIKLDDIIQMSCTGDHIYSYDFSEGFNMVDMRFLLKLDEDAMFDRLRQMLHNFIWFTERTDFSAPGLAREFKLDPEEMRTGMMAAVKRTAAITEDDLDDLSDELMDMYPTAVAVYYEECIRAIKEKALEL